MSRIRTNFPTSLGQVNHNTPAAKNWTRRLAWHQAAMWTQADWNSVCPRGAWVCPPLLIEAQVYWGPCRPFRAFRWFPICKPSSNSNVPVAWITEPATDYEFSFIKCLFRTPQIFQAGYRPMHWNHTNAGNSNLEHLWEEDRPKSQVEFLRGKTPRARLMTFWAKIHVFWKFVL